MKNNYIAKKNWVFEVQDLSKASEMAEKYDDIINLSIGDPDYPCDQGILKSMYEAGLKGYTHYTAFRGDPELRTVIANSYDKFGKKYDKDNVIITCGGTIAMYLLMQALLDPGDEVIVLAPYYIYYRPQIEMAGGKIVEYAADKDRNFTLDPEEIRKLINPRTKAIILNNPNNPTGKVYKPEEIQGLVNLIVDEDIILVADDIYCALNFTENIKPVCSYRDDPRIVTIYSFSKDFSATGLRLGYIMGDKDIIQVIQNLNESIAFTVNSMVQRSGIYAFENAQNIQKPMIEEYKKRLDYGFDRLSKMKNIEIGKPEGTFYLFPDIRQTGLNSKEVWNKILDEAHVLVLPGSGFGNAGEGFLRIACTVGIEEMKEAFDRIEKMDIFK